MGSARSGDRICLLYSLLPMGASMIFATFFSAQVSALTKTNRILGEKCLKTKDSVSSTMNDKGTNTGNEFSILKLSKDAPTEISTTEFQVEKSSKTTVMPAGETSLEQTFPAVDDSSRVEAVKIIQGKQVQYLWIAFFVALVSVIGVYLFRNRNQEV